MYITVCCIRLADLFFFHLCILRLLLGTGVPRSAACSLTLSFCTCNFAQALFLSYVCTRFFDLTALLATFVCSLTVCLNRRIGNSNECEFVVCFLAYFPPYDEVADVGVETFWWHPPVNHLPSSMLFGVYGISWLNLRECIRREVAFFISDVEDF